MSKQEILSQLCAQLSQQLTAMSKAAKTTHQAATGEEAKQEGKYDTRGLEASYLAGAQAEQSLTLAKSLRIFESLDLDDFTSTSSVEAGALVETESHGELNYYLLTPCAGGLSLDYEAGTLTTLSPEAPLYQQLLGLRVGDLLEPSDTLILEIS